MQRNCPTRETCGFFPRVPHFFNIARVISPFFIRLRPFNASVAWNTTYYNRLLQRYSTLSCTIVWGLASPRRGGLANLLNSCLKIAQWSLMMRTSSFITTSYAVKRFSPDLCGPKALSPPAYAVVAAPAAGCKSPKKLCSG